MRSLRWLVPIVVLFLLAGCAPGSGEATPQDPAGFFMGIWHGWIAPISLVWHLFNPAIRLYEVNNTGGWYDLGFYLAVISGFGSLGFTRGRWRKRQK